MYYYECSQCHVVISTDIKKPEGSRHVEVDDTTARICGVLIFKEEINLTFWQRVREALKRISVTKYLYANDAGTDAGKRAKGED